MDEVAEEAEGDVLKMQVFYGEEPAGEQERKTGMQRYTLQFTLPRLYG